MRSKCSCGQNGLVSGHGDENVADLGGFRHGHHAEAIHHGFDGAHRVDFGDDHVGAQALGAHGHALAAPAVSRDHHFQAGEQQIGRANDAVDRGLARAVAIVEEMLGLRVVHGDHRILQRAILGHGAQADHAGGGLFRAADDVGHQMLVLGEQQRHQVRAVVHGDLRLVIDRGVQVRVVGGVVFALDGKRGNRVILDQRGGHFILRGKRIRGAQNQIGAAIAQRDGQVGRFAGHVQAQRKGARPSAAAP